jgi:deoxyribose-phosphate aldolase
MTIEEVESGCELARRYEVTSVCCRPADVERCVGILSGSVVEVGTVIGFPHGAHATGTKAFEVATAAGQGATEFDMVLNIGWLRSGLDTLVEADIAAVVEAAEGMIVKVILETAYLDDEQKARACRIAESAGAAFVKTSTGFAGAGATLDDVRLMRATVSPAVRVKASGGIRSLEQFSAFLDAGCDRIGTSSTASLLDALA